MQNFIVVLIIVNLVALLAITFALLARLRRQQREIERIEQELASVSSELQALYAGAAGLGTHLARLESQLNTLSDRQAQLDVRDGTTSSYSDAIELVHQGASEEDLMERCGLLREEAELLIRLHRDDVVLAD